MLTICHRLRAIEIDAERVTRRLMMLRVVALDVCISAGFSPFEGERAENA